MKLCRVAVACLVLCGICGCGKPTVVPTPEVTASGKLGSGKPLKLASTDWPQWRGPNRDGISSGPAVPVSWKDESDSQDSENILWKVKIPGMGHSCPIIVGDRVYFETSDEEEKTQSVVCLNRKDGSQVWKKDLFQGHFETAMHKENTQASSTLCCDGETLFGTFLNDRRVWCLALDLNGEEVWRREVGGFASKFGFSASPELYGPLVIIAADHQSGGFIAGLNRSTGEVAWRKSRPSESSYASARVVKLGDQDQLILCGCKLVASYNPSTGEQIWSTPGTASAAVGTIVSSGDVVVASGGYPDRDTVALKADGSVAWRNNEKSYVPSLLAHEGYVYMVNDDGVAYCYEAKSGELKWRGRIGGNYRVSPVLNGGHLFITDMQGNTKVLKADPKELEVVAENKLGTEAFSSPAISNGQLFQRVAVNSDGKRQEWMYCIGNSEKSK